MNVVPKNPVVKGERDTTLNLRWEINGIPDGADIIQALVYFNESNINKPNRQNIICEWVFGDQQPTVTRGRNLFHDRISASYELNIYKLTLTKLQYNDTGLFLLVVSIPSGSDNATIIISEINGGYGCFIHLFCASI